MESPEVSRIPRRIARVTVPVDFSPASSVAVDHALRISMGSGAELELIHVQRRAGEVDWEGRLGIARRLDAWDVTAREKAGNGGVPIKTTVLSHDTPPRALTRYLSRHPADFLVLADHGRRGIERLFTRPVAMPVASAANTTALFIPDGASGFVRAGDGRLTLTRVIIPVDHAPPVEPALEILSMVLRVLRVPFVSCTFIHIGTAEKAPHVATDGYPWTCLTLYRRGDTVFEILRAAAETSADLIVMSTAGKKTIGDALGGSTAARVIREAPCPVLAVPASGRG